MNLAPVGPKNFKGAETVFLPRALPAWFKQEIPDSAILELAHVLSGRKVNTVCQSAACPNLGRCFKNRELTFMILGNICTRNCRFCAVHKSPGEVLGIDESEPERISQVVRELGIGYAVITSVTRDDLADGGAQHFVKVIDAIRTIDKGIKVEVLIPDFSANQRSIEKIISVEPSVMAHNLETVKRLCKELRPSSGYGRSLGVLKTIKDVNPEMITKSSLMLGLGEFEKEVIGAMEDLRRVKCDIITLGQYLAPSVLHYPVKEFIDIGQFTKYRDIARGLGFKAVLSEPLARSSYNAEVLYKEITHV
jgi:lipoic acid synthetase